jgi:hypothetical protein
MRSANQAESKHCDKQASMSWTHQPLLHLILTEQTLIHGNLLAYLERYPTETEVDQRLEEKPEKAPIRYG